MAGAKDDPEVTAHLHEENAYTKAKTEHLAILQEQLFDEVKSRTKETDLSVPTREGDWWDYTRTVEGQQYGIHCRVPVASPDDSEPPVTDESGAPLPGEQVLLDDNVEAEGHEFYSLGSFDVTFDGSTMLYAVDLEGDERYTIRIRGHRRHRPRVRPTSSRAPRPAPCSTRAAATSSTRPSTSRGGPTRSGGTRSAPRHPTTSRSSTSPTSGSGSASASPAVAGSS